MAYNFKFEASNVVGTLAVANGGTGQTTFTAGQVLFGNGTTNINSDSGLFWDNTNKRLGVGTASPSYPLHVSVAATEVARFQSTTAQAAQIRLQGTDRGITLNGNAGGGIPYTSTMQVLDLAGEFRSTFGAYSTTNEAFKMINSNGTVTYGSLGVDSSANLVIYCNDTTKSILLSNMASVGVGTTSPAARLHVDTGAVGTKGVLIKAVASQTANLFECQNSSGTVLSAIDSSGNFTGNAANVTGTVAIANGGTGQTTATAAINALLPSQTSNSGKYLTTDGTNVSWGSTTVGTVTSVALSGGTTGITVTGSPITSSGTFTLAGTLVVANGGTGATTFTAGQVLFGNTTSAISTDSGLFWDNTNKRLSIGYGSSPPEELSVIGTIQVKAVSSTDNVGINFINSAGTVVGAMQEASTGGGGGLWFKGYRTAAGGDGVLFVGHTPTTGNAGVEFRAAGGSPASPAALDCNNAFIFSKQTGSGTTVDMITITKGGTITNNVQDTTSVCLVLKAAASQTANFQSWQNSSGTVLLGVSAAGSVYSPANTTTLSANTNDLVLNGSHFQRMTCSSAYNLTGVAPPTGLAHSNFDGRPLRIYNVGSSNITLKHNSTSSAAANRFYCVDLADIVLGPRDFAELIYDTTDNGSGAAGWRVH